MSSELQRQFDALEALRRRVEEEAIRLNAAQGDWKPTPDVWNHREVVEHLVLSDEAVGHPAAHFDPEPWPLRTVPRALRRALITAAFRHNVVLPLPDPSLEPRGQIPVLELLGRWRRSRESMREDLMSSGIESVRYGHSILGPITAAQMLDLGIVHTEYHARQAAALRRHPGFPSEG